MKKVSIIIPTYNRAHLITETLESVIEQTYTNWECIVVDDGSTDNTSELLDKFCFVDERIKFFKRPKGTVKGPNACRNYGFDKSSGMYIKWLDSDDLLMPKVLEKQVGQLDQFVDVSVCKLKKVDLFTNQTLESNSIYHENSIKAYLIGDISFYVSGPLWRKSFLVDSKLIFDTDISNLDDWDFNLRALYKKPNISYLNEALIVYRVHKESLSQQVTKLKVKEVYSELYAREKHLKYLKKHQNNNYVALVSFTRLRLRKLLRISLVSNEKLSKQLLLRLVKLQMDSGSYKELVKVLIAFVSFKLFGRGYKFLK